VCQNLYALRVPMQQAYPRMNEAMGPKYEFGEFEGHTTGFTTIYHGDIFIAEEKFRLKISYYEPAIDSYYTYTLSHNDRKVASGKWILDEEGAGLCKVTVEKEYRKNNIGDIIESLEGISLGTLLMNIVLKDMSLDNRVELHNITIESVMGLSPVDPRIIVLLRRFGMIELDTQITIKEIKENDGDILTIGLNSGQPWFEIICFNRRSIRLVLKKKGLNESITDPEIYRKLCNEKERLVNIIEGNDNDYEAYIGGKWGIDPNQVDWLETYLEPLPSWRDHLVSEKTDNKATFEKAMTRLENNLVNNGLFEKYFATYFRSFQRKINPDGADFTVAYGAAWADISGLLLATGFTRAYFIDRDKVSLTQLKRLCNEWDFEIKRHHNQYIYHKKENGWSSVAAQSIAVAIEELLILELRLMGVAQSDVRVNEDTNSLIFKLPGEDREREIVFINSDVIDLANDADFGKRMMGKLDAYFEKASMRLPYRYPVYLPRIAGWIKPKGFIVLNPYTSDLNMEGDTDPFPVISANFKRVSVEEIEDRLNEDTAYVDTQFKIDDYYSYCGWRLFLFQKIEESMDSLRFFSEHTRDL